MEWVNGWVGDSASCGLVHHLVTALTPELTNLTEEGWNPQSLRGTQGRRQSVRVTTVCVLVTLLSLYQAESKQNSADADKLIVKTEIQSRFNYILMTSSKKFCVRGTQGTLTATADNTWAKPFWQMVQQRIWQKHMGSADVCVDVQLLHQGTYLSYDFIHLLEPTI